MRDMDLDQQIARDRHVELLGSIKDLREELTATRLEVKTDLLASRNEYLSNLATHATEDLKKFAEIEQRIEGLSSWKNKSTAIAGVLVLVASPLAAFLTAAYSTGRIG